MNRRLNLPAVPGIRPSRYRPLPLLATPAPTFIFPPFCFQSLAHSSAIKWGWGVPRLQTVSSRPKGGICFFSVLYPVSPLEPALPDKRRVSPSFDRNRQWASSLESAPTRIAPHNLFRSNTYEKPGGGGRVKEKSDRDHQDRRISPHSLPRFPCTIADADTRCNND